MGGKRMALTQAGNLGAVICNHFITKSLNPETLLPYIFYCLLFVLFCFSLCTPLQP